MIDPNCFKLDKLVRDLIPAIMRARGISVNARTINAKDEYIHHLKAKLLEEAKEVVDAETLDEIAEELADVLEVIYTLSKVYHLSIEAIEAKRLAKKEERGGFDQRIYCAYIEIQPDNKWIDYFLKRPAHYPMIKIPNRTD